MNPARQADVEAWSDLPKSRADVSKAGSPERDPSGAAIAAQQRAVAAKRAKHRLKLAARYAGAGLAVSPPFLAVASSGKSSLEAFLSRWGVEWER